MYTPRGGGGEEEGSRAGHAPFGVGFKKWFALPQTIKMGSREIPDRGNPF